MEARMSRHTRKHPSKREAIELALGRLGWHASGRDVVAFLANCGIDVAEGLVSKVKMDGLKKSVDVRRMRMQGRLATRSRDRKAMQKVPQPRAYRR
jgi:hypothetical protein